FLERADLLRHPGLGGVKALGRVGDVQPSLGHLGYISKLLKIQSLTLPSSLIPSSSNHITIKYFLGMMRLPTIHGQGPLHDRISLLDSGLHGRRDRRPHRRWRWRADDAA